MIAARRHATVGTCWPKAVLIAVPFFAPFAFLAAAQTTLPISNVIPLTMKTPRSGFNRMVVSVTLCAPGTSRCATIDDIMVDTGSTGLRIEASALPLELGLPPFLGPDGVPLAECLRFIHDAAWGPLVRANVRLGGLTAADIPIQIIADNPPQQPEGCPPSQVYPTSNGTLGVGPHLFDCPGNCVQIAAAPTVFKMERGLWIPNQGGVAPAFRMPNPISRLPVHDNGVVIDLPAARHGAEIELRGTLTFGVGTAANNQLGDARVTRLDRRGYFTTLYGGLAYPESYLDSGTMTLIVDDEGIPRCARLPWAFCLDPSHEFAATMIDGFGGTVSTSFVVSDYQAIGDHHYGAAGGAAIAAAVGTKSFVWGAPYFPRDEQKRENLPSCLAVS